MEQPFGYRIDDDCFQLLVADAGALASSLAASQISGAAVTPRLSQSRSSARSRISDGRIWRYRRASMALIRTLGGDVASIARDTRLHFELLGLGNNRWDGDDLPFCFRSLDAVADVMNPVKVLSAIGRTLENILDV